MKAGLGMIGLLLASSVQAEAAAGAEAGPGGWLGDVALGLSYSDTGVESRRYTAGADLRRRREASELTLNFDLDREFVRLADGQTQLDRDRHDLRLGYRHDLRGADLFAFVSPRWRRNESAFYVQDYALRGGLGARWAPLPAMQLTLEGGAGYREARAQSGQRFREGLGTVLAQGRWQINPQVEWRLELAQDQSGRERSRSLESSLRTGLGGHLALQLRGRHERANAEGAAPTRERVIDLSLSYEFAPAAR